MWRTDKFSVLQVCRDLTSLRSHCTAIAVSQRLHVPLENAQMGLLRACRQGLLARHPIRWSGTGCGTPEAYEYWLTQKGCERLSFFEEEL